MEGGGEAAGTTRQRTERTEGYEGAPCRHCLPPLPRGAAACCSARDGGARRAAPCRRRPGGAAASSRLQVGAVEGPPPARAELLPASLPEGGCLREHKAARLQESGCRSLPPPGGQRLLLCKPGSLCLPVPLSLPGPLAAPLRSWAAAPGASQDPAELQLAVLAPRKAEANTARAPCPGLALKHRQAVVVGQAAPACLHTCVPNTGGSLNVENAL